MCFVQCKKKVLDRQLIQLLDAMHDASVGNTIMMMAKRFLIILIKKWRTEAIPNYL